MLLYEEMIELYPNAHPYFLVRLAEVHASLRSGSIGVGLYRKAQGLLADMGIIDDALDGTVEAYAAEVDEKANAALVKSQAMSYYQTWRPTKQHRFPTNLPKPPPGHQEVKDEWQVLTPATPLVSPFLSNYMKKLAIDTNHLEGTFHITEESAQDLVRRGISDGTVDCLLDSALQDSAEIKGILNDTLKHTPRASTPS
ncbi:hypothetical protein OF83DRAFT_166253 [Amylostereum chailletii]|nr:hypothetical protein OF83DRAFT_166253 [Amylostereum chailletii]